MKSSSVIQSAAFLATGAAVGAYAQAPSFTPTSIEAPFLEQFTEGWESRWSASEAVKQTPVGGETFSYVGVWSVEEPTVFPGIEGDKGLVIKTKAAHHAISAPLESPLVSGEKPLVVQYEVKLQKGLECGGAYIKLLSESDKGIQAEEYSDKTPYTIMFGPDKCGTTNKVHFIFNHVNPLTGETEEKHLVSAPTPKINKLTHLYTLIVNPDNTFEIKIDDEPVKSGSLLEDFEPSVNPSAEIDDPSDFKPTTWIDASTIPDPEAFKPADWDEDAPALVADEDAVQPEGWLVDEPHSIPDPDAEKPEEWDDEEDGDWIAPSVSNPVCDAAPGCGPWSKPMIANPEYKGKWSVPMIPNPEYKGIWAPAKIPNPDFFEDLTPAKFTNIGGVGFEIWTMTEDILFDNIYLGHSVEDAKALADETFHVKAPSEQEKEAEIKRDEDEESDSASSESVVEKYLKLAQDKFFNFVEDVKEDPVAAIKAHPDVAGALASALITLIGTFSLLASLIGSAGTVPLKETVEKKEAVVEEIKETVPEVAPVAADSTVKKRK